MSTPSKLFDLDFNNWHQWEPVAKTEINQFKDASSAINRGIKFISTQLYRPLTIEYMTIWMGWSLEVAKRIDLGMRSGTGQPFINNLSVTLKLCNSFNMNNKLCGHF